MGRLERCCLVGEAFRGSVRGKARLHGRVGGWEARRGPIGGGVVRVRGNLCDLFEGGSAEEEGGIEG